MSDNQGKPSEFESVDQLRQHIEMCCEAILEHTANLEDTKDQLIQSIVDGYEVKLEEMLEKRVDARVEIILKKHGLI